MNGPNKLECLSQDFLPSLMIASKTGTYQTEAPL
jgi:hypothetical protein